MVSSLRCEPKGEIEEFIGFEYAYGLRTDGLAHDFESRIMVT
jgi:hypothetical protein